MGLATAITGGIGLGTSLIGGLFGRKQRKQDEQARDLKLQSMRDQSAAAKQMMSNSQDLAGQSKEAWGTASPIYQNLLKEYQSASSNPYYYAAPDIEKASSNVYNQQKDLYQQLGRGPAQQYAASMARLNLGSQSQDAVRNARQFGFAGQSGIADIYNTRSNLTQNLSQQSLGSAAGTYGGLSNAQWQNYQSPWGGVSSAVGSLAPTLGQGLAGWIKPSTPANILSQNKLYGGSI